MKKLRKVYFRARVVHRSPFFRGGVFPKVSRTGASRQGEIEKGSLKSFRKSYSTHATKVFDGDTNKASKLTGHTRKETLERFYYQENQEEVIQSANKVAKIFTFN